LRVLGIDPGTRFTGYGVVEEQRSTLRHIAHGVIRADPDAPLEQRLKEIFARLSWVVSSEKPEEVAVEGLFTFRNARSALVLGHARGVALLVAAQGGLAVHEYPPAQVKRAVGASGAGGKDAVGRMVRTFLKIETVERADATDALAVAICHLNRRRAPSPKGSKRRESEFEQRLAPAFVSFTR
jgi:crossover junction endodeoxyribonuclease RuvC